MNIQDEILKIFQGDHKYSFEPASCLEKCSTFLNQVCRPGDELDPRSLEKAEHACNAYGYASELFLQNRYPSAATSILITAWIRFSEIQRETQIRIYRAGIGMYLAKTYLSLGDKGASFRWALLTQADDLLGEHAAGGGTGKHLLQSVLGMSSPALTELKEVAKESLDKIKNDYDNDWSTPNAFAEDVVTRFAYNNPEYAYLFAAASSALEFPLNKPYFESLLNKVNSDALTTKEKGDRLENLASYLFLLIPGLIPRRNLLEETLAFETDIVIRNLSMNTNIIADLFGRHFLAECKNWESPVGVRDVGYFLYRMRLTHAHFGVIFAKNGITGGDNQELAAYSLIRKAFHEDGNICIVIDFESLLTLARTEASFWSLMLERIERIRFGKAR